MFGQTAKSAPAEPVDGSSSHVNFLDWKRESKTIPLMAMYSGGRAIISNQGEADVVRIGSVTPDFFQVFKAMPIMAGNSRRTKVCRPVRARSSSATASGRNGWAAGTTCCRSPWKSAECPGRLSGWRRAASTIRPAPGYGRPSETTINNAAAAACISMAVGRLADGISAEAAQQEMTGIAAALEREYPDANFDTTVMVQTLHDRTVGNVRLALVVLLGAVAMLLLIACANVANLVLVRGASRQSEIAVRTALGAGPRRLVSYLLIENLVLALAGGVLGLLVASWGLDALRALAPANLPRLDDVRFDAPTFGFALAVVFATTVLFGLGPSLQLSRVPLSQVLSQREAVGLSRSRWTRSGLLVAEVGLSLVLLLGAGLLLRSLSALQDIDMGFDADGLTVFTVSLPAARYPAPQVVATFDQLDGQFRALPAVAQVARISGLPLGPNETVHTLTREDRPPPPPGQSPVALYRVVDPEYFQTMTIPLLEGRRVPAERPRRRAARRHRQPAPGRHDLAGRESGGPARSRHEVRIGRGRGYRRQRPLADAAVPKRSPSCMFRTRRRMLAPSRTW